MFGRNGREYLVFTSFSDSIVQHTIKVTSIFAFSEVLLDGQVSHFDLPLRSIAELRRWPRFFFMTPYSIEDIESAVIEHLCKR